MRPPEKHAETTTTRHGNPAPSTMSPTSSAARSFSPRFSNDTDSRCFLEPWVVICGNSRSSRPILAAIPSSTVARFGPLAKGSSSTVLRLFMSNTVRPSPPSLSRNSALRTGRLIQNCEHKPHFGEHRNATLQSVRRRAGDLSRSAQIRNNRQGFADLVRAPERRWQRYLDHLEYRPVDVKKGAIELLSYCRQEGILCGPATSAPSRLTARKLTFARLEGCFSVRVTADSVRRRQSDRHAHRRETRDRMPPDCTRPAIRL